MPQNKIKADKIANYPIVNMDFCSLYSTAITKLIISPNILRIRKIKKLFNL